MAESERSELVATWFGAFRRTEGRVDTARPAPVDRGALAERIRARRNGSATPEERELLEATPGDAQFTRDRRLAGPGIDYRAGPTEALDSAAFGHSLAEFREALILAAEREQAESFDPAAQMDEAVRAVRDLDGMVNTLRERLASWSAHGAPLPDPGDVDAFDRALETSPPAPGGPASDRGLDAARHLLAARFLELRRSRKELDAAISESVVRLAPNLSGLLGPALAARLIAQAGGLARLARLPSSTIQVLGAERAFFEHLRGRAPPPRHGLLFLHPDIQGAPRRLRGKLARALAGKAAIAARLDREGSAPNAPLIEAYRARVRTIRSAGPHPK
ncbi:MAG TPA: hypothetical protein VFF67_03515 [Thermoplasmata archaeon]|nr:hypothetical protein [Thermoplasmata archaeon]